MVVSPLWRGPGNIHGLVLDEKILATKIGYCSNTNGDRRFWCEDINVAFTNVQPHYDRMPPVNAMWYAVRPFVWKLTMVVVVVVVFRHSAKS